MKDLPQIVIIIGFIAALVLSVAAVLMPFVIISIDSRIAKMAKTLASMEDMMRNGR